MPAVEEMELDAGLIKELEEGQAFESAQAREELQALARERQTCRTMGMGEHRWRMPVFYFAALKQWCQRHGGKSGDEWKHDEQFMRELLRDNPEIRVRARSGKIQVGHGTGRSAVFGTMTSPGVDSPTLANGKAQVIEDRPGRFRKVYPNSEAWKKR